MNKGVRAAALIVALQFAQAAYSQNAGPPPTPDFSAGVGQWDIEGVVMGIGNTIICKMQTRVTDGSLFAYISLISAGSNGFGIMDAYVTKTALPDLSRPRVAIYFDGKKATNLIGGVKSGYLYVDISKVGTPEFSRITASFQHSKNLLEVATLTGYPTEKTMVSLTDAATAFDKRGVCSKAVMDIANERLKSSN